MPIINYECVYECVYDCQEDITKINLNKNGIYSFYLNTNTEFHHFIIFVYDEKIILKSTYGGQNNIITKYFEKPDFILKLQDLVLNNTMSNEEKKRKYCDLFGIIKLSFKILDLTNFQIAYTFREINMLI